MRLQSASATYHALRKLHAELIENAVSSMDFLWVYETAMQPIKIHCAECKVATSAADHKLAEIKFRPAGATTYIASLQ